MWRWIAVRSGAQDFTDSLAKMWPSEVATLGTLPEVKWPKIYFLSVFLKELPGKMVAIGSGHFGDPP